MFDGPPTSAGPIPCPLCTSVEQMKLLRRTFPFAKWPKELLVPFAFALQKQSYAKSVSGSGRPLVPRGGARRFGCGAFEYVSIASLSRPPTFFPDGDSNSRLAALILLHRHVWQGSRVPANGCASALQAHSSRPPAGPSEGQLDMWFRPPSMRSLSYFSLFAAATQRMRVVAHSIPAQHSEVASDTVKLDVDVGLWGPLEVVGQRRFIQDDVPHLTNLRACV